MQYLLLGLSFGLSAGLSPGPLMTLVITTSLRDGFWHGLRVAIAPFLTDLPIILLAVFVLNRLPPWALSVLGLAGGAYVVYLGWETIRTADATQLEEFRHRSENAAKSVQGAQQIEHSAQAEHAGPSAAVADANLGRLSLRRGAVVNLLNPHPYLFWGTVGAPTLLAAYGTRPIYAVAFLFGFYALLVGSKIGVAALIHSQSHLLAGRWYRRLLITLGSLLIGLGLMLAYEAVSGKLA